MLFRSFGGNGVTTFGVPDLRNRARVSVMSSGARLTSAVSGIDGTIVGSGGSTSESTTLSTSQIPAHTHTATVNEPPHFHTYNYPTFSGQSFASGTNYGTGSTSTNTSSVQIGITVSNGNTGGGTAHTNVQPTIVAGLTFIKT